MSAGRHRWGEPVRFAHKTERECARCGIVKVTRHEGGTHWLEFWRGLDRVANPPKCLGHAEVREAEE